MYRRPTHVRVHIQITGILGKETRAGLSCRVLARIAASTAFSLATSATQYWFLHSCTEAVNRKDGCNFHKMIVKESLK